MLKHLYISQYALIDTLNLDIDSGFITITGETGAGKSIIMGALGLIMGDRADTKVIRTGASKSVIEATFVFTDRRYCNIFETAELDYSDECIIRREITANGKSRAFINDTPVSQSTLRSITTHLIDIHSQYENLLLRDTDFQLSVVDTAARCDDELNTFRSIFTQYTDCRSRLKQLVAEADRMRAEKEYMQYQFDRLDEANIVDGEQETLEGELERINHTEEIKTDLGAAVGLLENDEYGIVSRMKEATNRVASASRFFADVSDVAERLQSLYIDLKDIDNELSAHFDSLEFDPARKEYVETRLDTIYSLEQKHRLDSCADLIELHRSLAQRLERIDNFDDEIAALEKQIARLADTLAAAAASLTAKRKAVAPEIAGYLTSKLINLGMPNAIVEVDISPADDYTSTGADNVQFLFTANKNMPLRPIVSVASGGEIARVMLALKSLTVRKSALSTIIFDEIDTGVSGEIAGRMAEMMAEMSHYIQVLTITHLPQIAARGTSHYKVYKTDSDTTTTTHISPLSAPQRITEIAEMLSGKNPSQAALNAASELLHL